MEIQLGEGTCKSISRSLKPLHLVVSSLDRDGFNLWRNSVEIELGECTCKSISLPISRLYLPIPDSFASGCELSGSGGTAWRLI